MTERGLSPILITGHSHTGCLGLLHLEPEGVIVKKLPTKIDVYGLSHRTPPPENFEELIGQHANGKHLVLLWQGNYHQAKFLFVEGQLFDFISSELPLLPQLDDAVLVPESLVEDALKPAIDNLGHAIKKIQSFGSPASITVVGTPPPKGDDAFIRASVAREFGAERLADIEANLIRLTPPSVMLKLWDLLMRSYSTLAVQLGASFLAVPHACKDDLGFLKPEYWSNDVTHANSKYGELLLPSICAHVLSQQGG